MNFQTTLTPVTSWSFHNPSAQDQFILAYTNSANITTYPLLVAANGDIGFSVTTSELTGRLALKKGFADWISLRKTQDGGVWHVHNPQEANRLLFYYTDASNVSYPGIHFLNNGRVSIGVDDQTKWPVGYRLYVKDGILAEKVKVALVSTTDWSDHVFAPDYRLLPLSEVESFITANCHLPGVPSAEEMVVTGLDLAKTDAMLMAKVEELTLYVIELKKELEALKRATPPVR
jgi:hypothetical protein